MNWYLLVSALAGLAAALGHAYLGERFVLRPMYAGRGDNRVLANATLRRVIRGVWHLPSFAWATIAAASLWFALDTSRAPAPDQDAVYLGAAIYLTGAIANLYALRRPHIGNIALAMAAVTLWLGAMQAGG